jgi:hypothetical protein
VSFITLNALTGPSPQMANGDMPGQPQIGIGVLLLLSCVSISGKKLTHRLALSGGDSVADYQAALRSVIYRSSTGIFTVWKMPGIGTPSVGPTVSSPKESSPSNGRIAIRENGPKILWI